MLFPLIAVTVLALRGGAAAQEADDGAESARRQLAEANNAFAVDWYQALLPLRGNLALSPLSATAALALAWTGAGGRTAEQLGRVLHLPADPQRVARGVGELLQSLQDSESVVTRIANRIFLQEGFPVKENFRQTAISSFRSDAQAVNFQTRNEEARQAINQWVEQNTESKIKNLFPEGALSVDAVAVLVNAIYFKGEWAKAFQENNTRDEPFHLSADVHTTVPMMNGVLRTGHVSLPELNASALELQYKGGSTRMTVILPDEVDGLPQLEENLKTINFTSLHFYQREVQIQMPKFKIETSQSLREILEKLGATDLFSVHCNLTGLTDQENVLVSKVLQKTYLEVNEQGTEAAVATAVEAVARSGRRRVSFSANHPFLYIIQGVDKSILFMGRVYNPN